MKKIKKLFVVLAAGMALMLPVQAMAAVDLNAKYEMACRTGNYFRYRYSDGCRYRSGSLQQRCG